MRANHRILATCILASAALGGCASEPVYFEGVGGDGRIAPDVRYVLQSDAGNEGSVTLYLRGWHYDEVGDRSTDTLRFYLTVDNASDDPITIPIDGVTCADDQQRVLPRIHSAMSHLPEGAPSQRTFDVAPHERTTIEMYYDTGAPGALRTTGSVTLDWAYRFRGQETRHQTRFLPTRYETRPAVVYRTSYYYGPTWYAW